MQKENECCCCCCCSPISPDQPLVPDPPSSPPPRRPVPLELRACLLERTSSSPPIRLPYYSTIARISPMTVLFDFLSVSSDGRNTGSPRVVFSRCKRLIVTTLRGKSQRASSPPSRRATLPSDGRAHCWFFLESISLFICFLISASSNLGYYRQFYLITLYLIFYYFGCNGRIRVRCVFRRS